MPIDDSSPGHCQASIRLNCPHCRNPIAIDSEVSDQIICPSCGSAFQFDPDRTMSWVPEKLPRLGKFELLEVVGRGGFGTVYRARDTELDRIVAVKVPRSGRLATKQDEDRFVREARSVAQLRHPGIVPVHEVGRHEAFPYIVSEFIDGVTLTDALSRGRLTFRESAEVVAQVAEALSHAHRQGVVHRDLKPSNILLSHCEHPSRFEERAKSVGSTDIRPGSTVRTVKSVTVASGSEAVRVVPKPRSEFGRAHVMDFGLARRDEGEITVTVDGQILGTPAYMSPEQARGEGHHVDGRADVYSLGSILYELLAGELPFRGNARMILHQVLNDEPVPPQRLNDRIPRDLETITLKCLAKEPARRYQSADELALDLRCWMRGEPIRAQPVRAIERAWYWLRRRPAIAMLILVLLASSGSLAAIGLWSYQSIRSQLYLSLCQQVHAIELARQPGWRAQALTAIRQAAEIRREDRLRYLAVQALVGEDRYVSRELVIGDDAAVAKMAISPDSRLVAIAIGSVVQFMNLGTGQPDGPPLDGGHGQITQLLYAPDGKSIACAGQDGTIRIWSMPARQLRLVLEPPRKPVQSVTFGPGPQSLSSTDGTDVYVWDIETGSLVCREPIWEPPMPAPAPAPAPPNAPAPSQCQPLDQSSAEDVVDMAGAELVGISSQQPLPPAATSAALPQVTLIAGQRTAVLIVAAAEYSPVMWRLHDRSLVDRLSLALPPGSNPMLGLSVDERYLIYGSNGLPSPAPAPPPIPALTRPRRNDYESPRLRWAGTLRSSIPNSYVSFVTNQQEPPREPSQPAQPSQPVQPLSDADAKFFIPLEPNLRAILEPSRASTASSPGANVIAAAVPITSVDFLGPGQSAVLFVYDLLESGVVSGLGIDLGNLKNMSPALISHSFLIAGDTGTVAICKFGGQELKIEGIWNATRSDLLAAALFPDDDRLLIAAKNRPIEEVRLVRPESARLLSPGQRDWWQSCIDLDCRRIAIAAKQGRVLIRDTGSGDLIAITEQPRARVMAWCEQGGRLLLESPQGLHFADLNEGDSGASITESQWLQFSGRFPHVQYLTFSASWDGRILALGGPDVPVIICQRDESGYSFHSALDGTHGTVRALAFNREGSLLAAVDDSSVQVWRTSDLHPQLQISTKNDPGNAIAFSPDGNLLAVGTARGRIVIVNLQNRADVSEIEGNEAVGCLAFSPDSHLLAVGSRDGSISLWTIPTCKRLAQWMGHSLGVASLAFGKDDPSLISCGYNGELRAWQLDRLRKGLQELGLDWASQ